MSKKVLVDSESIKAELFEAISRGNTAQVKHLIDNQVDVNSLNGDIVAPLHLAVAHHQIEIVKLLIDAGAQLNIRDNNGRTPLHIGIMLRNQNAVKLLIDAGARLDIMDAQGWTPLNCAYYCNNQIAVSALIDRHIKNQVSLGHTNEEIVAVMDILTCIALKASASQQNVINSGRAEEVNNSKGHKLEKEEIKQEDNQELEQVPSQEIEKGGNKPEPNTTDLLEQAASLNDHITISQTVNSFMQSAIPSQQVGSQVAEVIPKENSDGGGYSRGQQ